MGKGAVVSVPFGRSRARGVVVEVVDAPPEGVKALPVDKVVHELPETLVDLALWLAEYYGSTPARALELVAPVRRARRKEQAPPGERQSLEGEAAPERLSDPQVAAVSKVVGAIDARRRPLPALRRHGQRQDRGLPPGRRRRARAGARDDRARAGDRAGAANGRPLPGPLRRLGRDPALRLDRRGAARRARAHRERRRPRGRRRALRDLRSYARGRPDLRGRGARRVVQAGVRPALRRPHRGRQAGGARGRGGCCTAARRRGRRAGSGWSGSTWARVSAGACRR